jgi:hypothetical protein
MKKDNQFQERKFSIPQRAGRLKQKDMFDLDTLDDFEPFKTTINVFFSPTAVPAKTSSMFYKKKTPFTQFVNASYAGGVYFNPPVAGI